MWLGVKKGDSSRALGHDQLCPGNLGGDGVQDLLLGVRSQPARKTNVRDPRSHAIRDQVRGDGSHGVLSGRRGAEQTRGQGLRRDDGRRLNLVHDSHGDGAGAGADLGREDLLEALGAGNLLDRLEVLRVPVR